MMVSGLALWVQLPFGASGANLVGRLSPLGNFASSRDSPRFGNHNSPDRHSTWVLEATSHVTRSGARSADGKD